MKYCVECGCKLEGNEKICPECGYDFDYIKINPRSTNKAFFESSFLQTLSDQVDIFANDFKNVLRDFDGEEIKKQFESIDITEISNQTFDQLSDLKDQTFNDTGLFDDNKRALNRDLDYINNAKRKFKAMDNNLKVDYEKTNLRIIELCDKSIKLNDTNPEAYYLKGLALVNLKKYVSAIDEFINSLALDDENLEPRIAIANANRLNGDFDDAINVYDSVLEIDEDSFEALKGKAIVYYDMENTQKADEFFEKANDIETLDDKTLEIWNNCKNNQ